MALEKLNVWLASPQRVSVEDAGQLKELILQYPYYQPLRVLLAKANINQNVDSGSLAAAALYTNGQLLHNVLFKTDFSDRGTFNITENVIKIEAPKEINDLAEEKNIPEIDDQETFDEIGEVDLLEFTAPLSGSPAVQEDPISKIETLEDAFVLENIVSSDFFAFEQTLDTSSAPVAVKEEESRISNYHDDKLPYTFLWWLAKTRKEYQSAFQPYAVPGKQAATDLQQQYVEHIFHIQSPFNAEEILNNSPEVAGSDPKDVKLIDNFIKNAPQIGTPKADQIDNENKARKSAEDHYDLVTETLAKIYIEQMLYHKAIDTYEKLILKFPEKSRYFADLIQSIKKKI